MSSNKHLSEEVLIALRRIMRAIDIHSKRLVQRHGITGPQALLLKNLLDLKESPVGQLAKRVNLSQATVTDILDRLEKRGLIRRTRSDSDKRRVLVSATPSAEKVLRDASPLLEQRFIAAFGRLSEREQARIHVSLNRVAAMMGATDMDVAPMLSSESLTPGPEVDKSEPGNVDAVGL